MSGADVTGKGRFFGLLVRYWAYNMTLVHDQGAVWPGFSYTLGEQAALRAIARGVNVVEFWIWMALVVVFVLVSIAALGGVGLWLAGSTGSGTAVAVSGSTFTVGVGVLIVASLAVGFPAAMLLASVLTGKLLRVSDADLPVPAVREHYVHKLGAQFLRAALLGGGVIVAACLWLPERVWLLTHAVMPVLGPAVSIATVLWYLHRPAAPAQGADVARDSTSSST